MKKKKRANEPDPKNNYHQTQKRINYTPRKKTALRVYEELGFMSGLEIHQQLKTEKKLFCRCPAGTYQKEGAYDAEVVRHMRPTLSELGEYDGTALMEFKTRKTIIYRVANATTCTYDVDDTPPFKINSQALDIALEIALLLKTNIVGELHITRKQYLDGSIPTGFQRTAIVGIEGRIPLKHKAVRIIQLSVEEDSCREVSDIGHIRVYTTDRLGIPLIETVTYPDLKTPDEVAAAAHYIRYLTRSTGRVRTGIGAAREDVNVSIRGGTRVEIKGVGHISLIPELTHNEAFRQKSLLEIRADLLGRVLDVKSWKPASIAIDPLKLKTDDPRVRDAVSRKYHFRAVNLPAFRGILSFFNQPGRTFSDEISDRLKVIAGIEKPNMAHAEEAKPGALAEDFAALSLQLKAGPEDAQIMIWGPEGDMPIALETVEERCCWAFNGVPNETRKSFADGTTMFERVLPGPDRMYPDTDSAPIPIDEEWISRIRSRLPVEVEQRLKQLHEWEVPPDAFAFLLKHNLVLLIERIVADFSANPRFVALLFAHRLKRLLGKSRNNPAFPFERIRDLFAFVRQQGLQQEIIFSMLAELFAHPNMQISSILATLGYQLRDREEILSHVPALWENFRRIDTSKDPDAGLRWIMKQLRPLALGNMALPDLAACVNEGRRP